MAKPTIDPGVVSVARATGRMRLPWVVAGCALLVLNYLFPAVQRDVEVALWQTSLSTRPDSVLSTYILDGALTWIGLTLSFCVSAGMYRLAFKELLGEELSLQDLRAGFSFVGSFLPMAFVAVVAEELLWAMLSGRLSNAAAVTVRVLAVWICVTPFIFTVPLMVHRKLPPLQAMSSSLRAVSTEPLNAFLLLLVAGFWANVGAIVLIVGVVFTLPTYHRAIVRAYSAAFAESS